MEIEPVGFVRTCFGEKFGVPRQPGLCPSAWGTLVFEREFRSEEALRGIEGFSHLWLVFGFDRVEGGKWSPTVRPPRLGGNQRIGVFASRSTRRPNGFGLSLVKLESVDFEDKDGPVLVLGGVDMVDGTPVYDVKPYLPFVEALAEARGGYAEVPPVRVVVRGTDLLVGLEPRARRVVEEVLSFDPRPTAARAEPEREHGVLLCGVNVRFRFEGGECRILEVAQVDSVED